MSRKISLDSLVKPKILQLTWGGIGYPAIVLLFHGILFAVPDHGRPVSYPEIRGTIALKLAVRSGGDNDNHSSAYSVGSFEEEGGQFNSPSLLGSNPNGDILVYDPVNINDGVIKRFTKTGTYAESFALRDREDCEVLASAGTDSGLQWIGLNDIRGNYRGLPLLAFQLGHSLPVIDWRDSPPSDVLSALVKALGSNGLSWKRGWRVARIETASGRTMVWLSGVSTEDVSGCIWLLLSVDGRSVLASGYSQSYGPILSADGQLWKVEGLNVDKGIAANKSLQVHCDHPSSVGVRIDVGAVLSGLPVTSGYKDIRVAGIDIDSTHHVFVLLTWEKVVWDVVRNDNDYVMEDSLLVISQSGKVAGWVPWSSDRPQILYWIRLSNQNLWFYAWHIDVSKHEARISRLRVAD